MKKLMMFSAAIVLALTVAAEGETASVPTFTTFNSQNTLGIQRVATADDIVARVPVDFSAVGGGDVVLADTLYLDNLNMADTVQTMINANGYYSQWIWLPGFMEDLYWTARRDGDVEIPASERTLPRGVGLHVSRASISTPVYTVGQYSTESRTLEVKRNMTTLLANPSSTQPLDIDTVFVGDSISELDRIFVKDQNQELMYQYSKNGDGNGKHWYRTETEYYVDGGNVASSNKWIFAKQPLAPGVTFRYQRKGLSTLKFSW